MKPTTCGDCASFGTDDGCRDAAVGACPDWAPAAKVEAEQLRAEAERDSALGLACIGEHHFPDLTYKARLDECVADLRKTEAEAADLQRIITVWRGRHDEDHDRADKAEEEVAQLRAALMTIERSGAAGGAIVAERADGHACGWCRGMLTPCPVVVARKALAGAQEGGE